MKQKIHLTSSETLHTLQEKGVSRTTAWRALNRGWYYGELYHNEGTPVNKAMQERFIRITSNKSINKKALWAIPDQKMIDVKRGLSTLYQKELKDFKIEVTEIRNLLREFMNRKTEANLKNIISDRRIKQHAIFNKKMIDRLRKGLSAYPEEIEEAAIEIAKLYSNLKI